MPDFLSLGIDRYGAILSPVRSPSPAHQVSVHNVAFEVAQGNLCRRSDVVPFERLIANGIDQSIGHAQGGDEVANSAVLRKSSADCLPAYLIIPTKIDRKAFRKLTVYSYSIGSRAS